MPATPGDQLGSRKRAGAGGGRQELCITQGLLDLVLALLLGSVYSCSQERACQESQSCIPCCCVFVFQNGNKPFRGSSDRSWSHLHCPAVSLQKKLCFGCVWQSCINLPPERIALGGCQVILKAVRVESSFH